MNFRQKGLFKLLGGAVAYGLYFGDVFHQETFGDFHANGFTLIVMGVPGAVALMGLIELTTGVPFTQLAARWDALKSWQRAVLGSAIVIAAATLIFGTLFVIGWYTHSV